MAEKEDNHEDYYEEPAEPTIEEQQLWELNSISAHCEEQRQLLEKILLKLDEGIDKSKSAQSRLENSLGCFTVILVIAIFLIVAWAIKQI